MTQGALNYEPSERLSLCDRVESLFRSKPNQWIPAQQLMAVGGSMAWRTRISNCRKDRGMTIENRVQRRRYYGVTIKTSEYRFVPGE